MAQKLHAHSVQSLRYAHKLVTIRRAMENSDASHSQVLEPALWWRRLTALLSQCVSFSLIDVGRVSPACLLPTIYTKEKKTTSFVVHRQCKHSPHQFNKRGYLGPRHRVSPSPRETRKTSKVKKRLSNLKTNSAVMLLRPWQKRQHQACYPIQQSFHNLNPNNWGLGAEEGRRGIHRPGSSRLYWIHIKHQTATNMMSGDRPPCFCSAALVGGCIDVTLPYWTCALDQCQGEWNDCLFLSFLRPISSWFSFELANPFSAHLVASNLMRLVVLFPIEWSRKGAGHAAKLPG
eukprot:1161225-Pelagomonas_calceolata.AAC.13